MKKKRVMAGILVGALAVGGHQVWAATCLLYTSGYGIYGQ